MSSGGCLLERLGARFTEDASPAGFAKIMTAATRLVWIETPTNPLLQILDAGICLSGADEELNLSSLPSAVREAIRTGQLNVFRHA